MSTGTAAERALRLRHRLGGVFEYVCLASTWFGLLILFFLIVGIVWQSWGWLDWDFLQRFDSRFPEKAGIKAGLWGSVWLIFWTAVFSVPIGVGAAIYLEEYSSRGWLTKVIQVNITNLAGVPSIVYGMLGLTAFVRMFGMFEIKRDAEPVHFLGLDIPIPLGRVVISGSLTLTLLILPVVITASQEALRAIPQSIRHASIALGATHWQTIRHQVLPAAVPGILTGVILAISRALGETAPLIMIGALTYVAFTPADIESFRDVAEQPSAVLDVPFSSFTALPIQIYNWVSRPKKEYQHVAAAGILVLLAVLLVMNAIAIIMRNRFQKRIRW